MFAIQKKLFLLVFILLVGLLALVGFMLSKKYSQKPLSQNPSPTSVVFISTSTLPTNTSSTAGTQIYHNTKYGFEFQYPQNWKFEENTFYSPFSKFNLVGVSPEENNHPNPIASPLLVNIVTPDFADRAVVSMQNLGANKSDALVASIQGTKYVYLFEGRALIDVILPLESITIIFEADQKYEDIFNQILVTFKFF